MTRSPDYAFRYQLSLAKVAAVVSAQPLIYLQNFGGVTDPFLYEWPAEGSADVPLSRRPQLGSSLDQNRDRGLGVLFTSATPVQVEQHVHIPFASLDFGDIGLIYFEPHSKFCLRQAGSAPKGAQMLS